MPRPVTICFNHTILSLAFEWHLGLHASDLSAHVFYFIYATSTNHGNSEHQKLLAYIVNWRVTICPYMIVEVRSIKENRLLSLWILSWEE